MFQLAVQEFINESEGRPSVMPQSRDSASGNDGSVELRRRNLQSQAPTQSSSAPAVAQAPLMAR